MCSFSELPCDLDRPFSLRLLFPWLQAPSAFSFPCPFSSFLQAPRGPLGFTTPELTSLSMSSHLLGPRCPTSPLAHRCLGSQRCTGLFSLPSRAQGTRRSRGISGTQQTRVWQQRSRAAGDRARGTGANVMLHPQPGTSNSRLFP